MKSRKRRSWNHSVSALSLARKSVAKHFSVRRFVAEKIFRSTVKLERFQRNYLLDVGHLGLGRGQAVKRSSPRFAGDYSPQTSRSYCPFDKITASKCSGQTTLSVLEQNNFAIEPLKYEPSHMRCLLKASHTHLKQSKNGAAPKTPGKLKYNRLQPNFPRFIHRWKKFSDLILIFKMLWSIKILESVPRCRKMNGRHGTYAQRAHGAVREHSFNDKIDWKFANGQMVHLWFWVVVFV